MAEFTVSATPVSLATALGVNAGPPAYGWLGRWRIENQSRRSVYRLRAADLPDTAAVTGFRHPASSSVEVDLYSDDLGAVWLWTSTGSAGLIAERLPGSL